MKSICMLRQTSSICAKHCCWTRSCVVHLINKNSTDSSSTDKNILPQTLKDESNSNSSSSSTFDNLISSFRIPQKSTTRRRDKKDDGSNVATNNVVTSNVVSSNVITSNITKSSPLVEQYKQSAAQQDKPLSFHPICRTMETNPWRHTEQHEGLFYTIPPEEFETWFTKGLMPHVYRMFKSFKEYALMVRHPAVEVISCLHNTNLNMPVNRYVLYGRVGSGKSTSLAHVVHACGREDWMVLQLPWVSYLIHQARDFEYSTYKPGRINQPMAAAEWLSAFRLMNRHVLEKHQPKTVNRYVWTKRETTEVGTLWTEVIDYALTRPRYASDVIGLITKEVRTSSESRQFPVLVVIDGVNAFWEKTSYQQEVDKSKYHYPCDVTIIRNFMKLIKNNWSKGAVLTTVDVNAMCDPLLRQSDLPQYLLGKEGFELFDPFLPIHVPSYTDKELHSCLEYYTENKWLVAPTSKSTEGRQEMIFLSSRNPLALYNVTRHW